MYRFFRKNDRYRQAEARLAQVVQDWKSAQPEDRLSDSGRMRVLNAVLTRADEHEAPLSSLFPRYSGRLVLAAVLPALLLAVALGYWSQHRPEMTAAPHAGTLVQVEKQGDQVLFIIANGTRSHNVYKSNNPQTLGSAVPFRKTDGSFRDQLRSGANVVFYRID